MWISIEANIGAGKSTLLRELIKRYPELINVIGEPLEEWQAMVDESKGNQNILELFYNDIWVDFTSDLDILGTKLEDDDKKECEKKLKGLANKFVRTRY